MFTDRVRQQRTLKHQKLAAAMQHQTRLLLLRLRRHSTEGRIAASQIAANVSYQF